MEIRTGFVTEVSKKSISFRVPSPNGDLEGEYFPHNHEFMSLVVEGTYLDITVDSDGEEEYVTFIAIKDVPKWTKEELDAADKRAKKLMALFDRDE